MKSFRAKKFIQSGYPRNDYLLADDSQSARVDGDDLTLQSIQTLKAEGKRIVVYAPTFRDSGGTPFSDAALNLLELKRFAELNNIVIVAKLHPYVNEAVPTYLWPNVLVYNPDKDSAPLLKLADLLVTDYSSIYFDYLLLDRPLVFFAYDHKKYFAQDRGLLFDYDEYTPGMKCYSQGELFDALLSELEKPDIRFVEARQSLKEKSFTHCDGHASHRLWDEIKLLQKNQ